MRILIVRVGAMGDILHGLPALAALQKRCPDCFVGWAIEPHWKPLLAAAEAETLGAQRPQVNRIHDVPTKLWKQRPFSLTTGLDIARLRKEMKAERYDVCVDLQGSIRSAIIGRLSGAARFIGMEQPRERAARFLYHERVALRSEHVTTQACELVASALGKTGSLDPEAVVLPVEAVAEDWAETFLRSIQMGAKERFVLLAPTAGWGAKQWPTESYRALSELLRVAGFRVVVNTVNSAEPIACSIAEGGRASIVACGVSQLIALTRRTVLVIGGDTGPVHLAAALGRPVVALFGPTDPRRNGPFFPGARTEVLRHCTSVIDHRRHAETEAGLAKITVEEVVTAAMKLLEERENG